MEQSEAFLARDRELNAAYAEDGNPKMKAQDRERARKSQWLKELIRFQRKDSEGRILKGCEWRIVRRKISPRYLQELVNRCPIPCTVDYVYDDNGVAHWLDDLLMTALPDPAVYIIVPRIHREVEDILKDPTFQGQTVLLLKQVPLRAVDDRTSVGSEELCAYLNYAVAEEDPAARKIEKKLEKVKKEVDEIVKVIKKIPKQVIRSAEGKPLSAEDADAERQVMFTVYGQAKYELDLKVQKVEEELEAHRKWRRSMGMDFILSDIDQNTETATWEVRLFGSADAQKIEEIMVRKDDWQGLQLCCAIPEKKLPPWVGRGKIPDGSKPYMPDYSQHIVNISGSRLVRAAHGVGTVKALDGSKPSSIQSNRFGLFYGDFHLGMKTGYGVEINDSEVFAGRFINGLRDGNGRMDIGNGTAVAGQFKMECIDPTAVHTKGMDNPYMDGEPTGKNIEVHFADGAIYRGGMLNGRITGEGIYESAFGETLVGTFKDGVLDCEIGKYSSIAGETYIGRWRNGQLNGKSMFENSRGDKYKGWFKDGLKQGRGHEIIKGKGEFKGFFHFGLKNGKGELLMLKRKKRKKQFKKDIFGREVEEINVEEEESKMLPLQADETSKKYLHKYQGYFIADEFQNGGIIMDTILQTALVVAKRDFTRTGPLKEYRRQTDRLAFKIRRITEKLNDMERHIRLEMLTKKRRVFQQQKHYLKKTMYFDDEYGVDQHILDARTRVREHRLKKIDDACLASDNARVPRLQLKKEKEISAHHLKAAFDRIIPSVAEDDKATGYDENYPYQAGDVEKILPQVALSDFEEARERQALTKYDNMWARAEAAYIAKKKKQNQTLSEAVAKENAAHKK